MKLLSYLFHPPQFNSRSEAWRTINKKYRPNLSVEHGPSRLSAPAVARKPGELVLIDRREKAS